MKTLIPALICLFLSIPCQAVIIYVDGTATGANDGSSWEDAYNYLQDALYDPNLIGPAEIWVAQGTYKPDQGAGLTPGSPNDAFQLISGVAIYGGFPSGGDPNWNDRDPNAYETILSGDLNGDDEPNFVNNDENSYHVVISSGADETAVLDGFTITAGNADGPSDADRGGGMYNNNSSSPTVTNCTFRGNSGSRGGGMYNYESSPTVTRCTFRGNLTIEGSFSLGGGMYNNELSSPMVSDCIFIGNSAEGAYYTRGGGIYNQYSDGVVLVNCIFSGNMAVGGTYTYGGGVYNYQCSPTITNCTFSGNSADDNGGGVYNGQSGSQPAITNCIFWGNTPDEIAGTNPVVTYSDIQGGWVGTGNINADPLFVDSNNPNPNSRDYHLQAGSPCIDAGDPNGDYTGRTDIDGEPRVMGWCVDMGSDESGDLVGISYFVDDNAPGDPGPGNPDVSDPNEDGSREHPYDAIQEAINAATDGNTIGVFDGIYTGNGNRNIDFDGRAITVCSQNGPNNCIIDCEASGRGFYFNSGEDGNSVLDGFTIVNGYASDGGGIRCTNSSPTIRNCVINGNTATNISDGGGIRCHTSNATITNCTISGNTATRDGAGIWCYSASGNPTVSNCDISSNDAGWCGGGVYAAYSSPTISNCTISNNTAQFGDGIFSRWNNSPTVSNSTIRDNSPNGILLDEANSTLLIAGVVHIISNNIVGEGSLQIDPNASLNLDDAEVFCGMSGAGTMEIEVGAEATIDGNAIIDLGDPCDPNVRGTIDCEGLLQVKDNAQITNANVNITRAIFEDDANVTNCEIHVDSNAPYGQFFIDANASFTYNDIHADGDRYMDLDPNIFSGLFVYNRIFVTITEGVGQTRGGLFELRGDPNFADPSCDPNEFMCQMDPCTIPDCNLATWTIERLELIEGAKLNLTNRFGFQPPYDPGSDDDVLYVKELVLRENSILNTSYNWAYYETLVGDLNDVTNIPLLGFSLINIALDDEVEFKHRVTHNNFIDLEPDPCDYTRIHVKRVDGNEPDPNGMMQMCNLRDLDPCSLHYQEVVNARAKGLFAKASEDEDITIEFEYLFVEDPCNEAEMVIYLSDEPEVNEGIIEVARIRPPAAGRPGSIGSGRFAVFFGTFPRGDLNFKRGTYVELELRGTDTRCLIDNWDPTVYCIICGDYDGYGFIDITDYLLLLAEYGVSDPSSATPSKACMDLDGDGCVDVDDLLSWDIDDVLNTCQLWESLGSTFDEISTGETLSLLPEFKVQSAGESEPLLMLGKPGTSGLTLPPDSSSYNIDSNGICMASAPSTGNGRLMKGSDGNIYQIHGDLGLIHQDTGTPVVEPNDNLSYEGSLVSVGINNGAGLPLADAAFSPTDPNIVYVVPVLVNPQDGNCHYMAAAKLELAGADDYNLLELYGKNPAESDPCNTPKDCDGDILYEPDVQHLSEIEIDNDGNLFVLSAHWFNENNWILIYDEAIGNDSEVRVQISEPNLTAPTAMVVSSIKKKLYLASSVTTSSDLMTEVHRFSIDKTTPSEPNLVFDNTIDINCPEPAICDTYPSLCGTGLGYISTITSMIENPADGTLYVTGFTAPKFAEEGYLPSQIIQFKGIFTTPMLAVLPPDSNEPVEATEIIGCDLALPLSIAWTWTEVKCGGADLDESGEVSFTDFSILASQWLSAPGTPSADIAPEPDGIVDLWDLAVLVDVDHWLETGCN